MDSVSVPSLRRVSDSVSDSVSDPQPRRHRGTDASAAAQARERIRSAYQGEVEKGAQRAHHALRAQFVYFIKMAVEAGGWARLGAAGWEEGARQNGASKKTGKEGRGGRAGGGRGGF